MKKIFLLILILAGLAGASILVFTDFFHTQHAARSTQHEKYTCPMHPQIIMDKPGSCPICGMTLVPVSPATLEKDKEAPKGSFFVSPERRQLIGIAADMVVEKPLLRSVILPGRIAYDSDLYVTENEYVEGLKQGSEAEVMQTILTKMKRLGISDAEIAQMKKTRKADTSLFLPKAGGPFWVYASLYEIDWEWIKPGMQAKISVPYDKSIVWEGEIEAVMPVLDAATRTAKARILVERSEQPVKPDTYVDVKIEKDLGMGLAVPASAVIDTGTRQLVFIDLGDGYLLPREVRVGAKAGDDYPVAEGLAAGDKVVVRATFLVDSESQLKAAIAGMGKEVPAEAGHKH